MARKYIDCREFPSQSSCTLTISGEENEVLRAGVMHAVDVHGEKDTPEFREQLRGAMKDESEMGMRREPTGAGREQPAMH